jgi:TetR/AcrR family transcriptional regulator, regulator of cefoperazone and chloramphenicol sensitivity
MRARIRDAAISLFGRDGYDRASVRAIADLAGASPALVIHHFGSKEQLRAECDTYVVDFLFEFQEMRQGETLDAAVGRWLNDLDVFRPMVDYLARMLAEESDASRRLFDRLLAGTNDSLRRWAAAGLMRESSDPAMLALLLTVYSVGPLLMRHHLARILGEEMLSQHTIARMTLPLLEVYTNGLFTDDSMLRAARAALGSPGVVEQRESDIP